MDGGALNRIWQVDQPEFVRRGLSVEEPPKIDGKLRGDGHDGFLASPDRARDRPARAPDKLVDLPHFVSGSFTISGKSGTSSWGEKKDTIRTETPVLYFYPKVTMDVTVSASFPAGRITEVFEPPLSPGFRRGGCGRDEKGNSYQSFVSV